MGTTGTTKEVLNGHNPIQLKIIYKVKKCVCKITIGFEEEKGYNTGFFIKEKNWIRNLYQKTMRLICKDCFTICMEFPKDLAIIKINKYDIIEKDIISHMSNYSN